MNEDARQAGIAILQDLAIWNRSAVFLEQEIEATAVARCEEAVIDWCRDHDWIKDGHGFNDLEQNWFCPRNWKRESGFWLGSFWFCRHPGHSSNSYVLADLVGAGQADFGFFFDPQHAVFGGKTAWLTYLGSYPEAHDKIARRGWQVIGEGKFFRPVGLKLEMLQQAWSTGKWSYLTEPIVDQMDKFLKDVELFDELLTGGL